MANELDQVHQAELEEIEKRRISAKIMDSSSGASSLERGSLRRKAVADRVGLALSGGGVRSGSFNLGIMQAFYECGLLRYIDYLSTVSGGGYVGSFFSSLVNKESTKFYWEDGQSKGSTFPLLERLPNGRQPPQVRRLIRGGAYLKAHPFAWLSEYAKGLLLTNVTVLSGLLFAMAALGWLFRELDSFSTIQWLNAAGFDNDIRRAFFPSFVFFIVWIITLIGSSTLRWAKLSRRLTATAQFLSIVWIGCLLLATASLLMTGDISFTAFSAPQARLPAPGNVQQVSSGLKWFFGILIAVGLIPFLRIPLWIRSGERNGPIEGWIFKFASYSLLVGLPLVLFSIFSAENISRYNDERPDRFLLNHRHFGPNWKEFWKRVRWEQRSFEEDSTLPFAPSELIWNVAGAERIAAALSLEEEIEKRADSRWFVQRVAYAGGFFLDSAFQADLRDRLKLESQRDEIVKSINDRVLSNPAFPVMFSTIVDKQPSWLDGNAMRTIEEFCARATAAPAPLPAGGLSAKATDQLEVQEINRRIFDAYYDGLVRDRSTVFAYYVHDPDQSTRFRSAILCLGVFLCSGTLVNLNWTSLHRFYRDRLAEQWLDSEGTGSEVQSGTETNVDHCMAGAAGNEHPKSYPASSSPSVLLSELDTCKYGAPYLIVNATLNAFNWRQPEVVSSTARFLFSRRYSGSPISGYCRTRDFESNTLRLDDVVAISGAAASPMLSSNPLVLILLLLLNVRLGRWVENPSSESVRQDKTGKWRWVHPILWRATFLLEVGSALLGKLKRRPNLFLTDGGHHENLGIEALIARRCRVIIASDATQDQSYSFHDFHRFVRRCESDFGIRIQSLEGDDSPLPLCDVVPSNGLAKSHWFIARFQYPGVPDSSASESEVVDPDDFAKIVDEDVTEGFIIYLKPNFTGDESADLQNYRRDNQLFPHDPTLDQFYESTRFDAYRRLGYHIGEKLCEDVLSLHCDKRIVNARSGNGRCPVAAGQMDNGQKLEETLASWTPVSDMSRLWSYTTAKDVKGILSFLKWKGDEETCGIAAIVIHRIWFQLMEEGDRRRVVNDLIAVVEESENQFIRAMAIDILSDIGKNPHGIEEVGAFLTRVASSYADNSFERFVAREGSLT